MSFATTPTQTGTINGFATAVASTTLTATAAGSLIVVGVTSQLATGNSVSVTDNIGNTYTLAVGSAGTSQRHEEIWYCLSASAGVTAVTVNNAASTNVGGYVQEWAGGASVLRTPASLNNASGTSTAATVTPAVGDVIFGTLGYQAAVASTRQETTADATYTALPQVTRGTTTMVAGGWKIATSTAATGPSWTMSPAVATGAATAAFAPASPASTNGSVTAPASAATATSSAAPVVTGATNVAGGGAATASSSAPIPVVTGEAAISGGAAATASNSALAPAVTGDTGAVDATTAAAVASGSGTVPAPVVAGTSTFSASVTAVKVTATGSAPAPSVSAGAVAAVQALPAVATGNLASPAVTGVVTGVTYLYTPPLWNNIQQMEGSLRYKIPTSTTTFKKNGVWQNVQTPGMGVTDGATHIFRTPRIVTADLAAELQAYGVGTVTII